MRARTIIAVVAGAVVLIASPRTRAQPPDQPAPEAEQPTTEPEPETLPPEPEHTAADVAGAPLPGEESGRLDPIDTGDSTARVVGRAALFLPRMLIQVVFLPIHGLVWLNSRYDLEGRYYRTFFNESRTIGVYPTLAYETNIGLSIGATFINKNTFRGSEVLRLDALSGIISGDVGRLYADAYLNSGRRLGDRVLVTVGGDYDRLPNLPFFGIGNGDLNGTPMGDTVVPRINPLVDDTAFKTYYLYREARAVARGDVRIVDALTGTVDGEYTDLAYGDGTSSGEPEISDIYDPMTLIGFQGGVRHVYAGGELRYDTRQRVSLWEPIADATAGSLADVYLGRVFQLGGMADFWRYGIDLQHYFHLARGPRVLALRFRGDAVSGRRDQVPFTELPSLGGGQFLRGYDFLRFSDRLAAFAAAEYQWDLGRFTDAYLFGDVGRVYESWSALTLNDLRFGFGLGLRFHSDAGFLLEANIATSIDGGIFVSAAFNPTLSAVPRWR
jgi:hypothetical protein